MRYLLAESVAVVERGSGVDWLWLALLLLAVASFMFRRHLPGALTRSLCIASLSLTVALGVVQWWPTSSGALQDVARACGLTSLLWAVIAALLTRREPHQCATMSSTSRFVSLSLVVALLLAVVTVIIQSMVVVMRGIYVTLDVLADYPYITERSYGYGVEGLWSLGFLCVACFVSLLSSRRCRLASCQFWSLAVFVVWACLLPPALRPAPSGGFERTGNTLLLLAALSAMPVVAIALRRLVVGNAGGPLTTSGLPSVHPGNRASTGLGSSVVVLAVGVVLLTCFHLSVPVSIVLGGYRGGAIVVVASAAMAGLACLRLFRSSGRVALADAAMGLLSLALCALATLAVPSTSGGSAERYPMLFNTMIVGFAIATGVWTWIACSGRRHGDRGGQGSVPSRLVSQSRRLAFLSAALALVLGASMAAWPRWPAIAVMDDSLGRVSAGLAANLLLLLVMLWCSRRLRSPAFHVMTVFSVLSLAGFLIARMVPFTPQFG